MSSGVQQRAPAVGHLPEPLCEKELVAFLLPLFCERPSFPSFSVRTRFEEAARKPPSVANRKTPCGRRVTQPVPPRTQVRVRSLHHFVGVREPFLQPAPQWGKGACRRCRNSGFREPLYALVLCFPIPVNF